MKRIAVLGSTGVIGGIALEIVRDYPKEFQVVSLACKKRSRKFLQQVREFHPKISVATEVDGEKGLIKAANFSEIDLVVVAVVGLAGLRPTLAAIEAGKDVALATKEVLVVGGELVMRAVEKRKTNLIPIDSEHSAIFQCLQGREKETVRRIILTMGKGKISIKSRQELRQISVAEVLERKTWKMGKKIAVDSATCMNKAFEVIEAHWLFGVDPGKIETLVHPEYLCHSMVEMADGSIFAEIGVPKMKRYISYALFYPRRMEIKREGRLDLTKMKLSFEKPPVEKFPCLRFGYQALEAGGDMAAVIHGADEAAVESFLENKIGFNEIPKLVGRAMNAHGVVKTPSLKEIFTANEEGKSFVNREVKKLKL